MRSRPGQSADLPNEQHLSHDCGHGDPSLTPEGDRHMVLRKDEFEIRLKVCWVSVWGPCRAEVARDNGQVGRGATGLKGKKQEE